MPSLPIGNAYRVYITGVFAASAPSVAITDAVITHTLKTLADVVVAGCDGVSVPHTGSGNYGANATPTTDLTAGVNYKFIIESSNYDLYFEEIITASVRGFADLD